MGKEKKEMDGRVRCYSALVSSFSGSGSASGVFSTCMATETDQSRVREDHLHQLEMCFVSRSVFGNSAIIKLPFQVNKSSSAPQFWFKGSETFYISVLASFPTQGLKSCRAELKTFMNDDVPNQETRDVYSLLFSIWIFQSLLLSTAQTISTDNFFCAVKMI